jgi:hypothetical protein
MANGPDEIPEDGGPEPSSTSPGHVEIPEGMGRLEAAAIEAEFETGRRESSIEEAKASLLLRATRVTFGSIVTLVGILLLVLPGPGLIVVAAGLTLLAQDVPFARRLLKKVHERLPADAEGGVSKIFIVACSAGGVLFMAGSIWWTFLR